jgi:hypothetical protein
VIKTQGPNVKKGNSMENPKKDNILREKRKKRELTRKFTVDKGQNAMISSGFLF